VTVGALNVYHDAPMDWDDAGWRDAQMLADLATTFVVSSRDLEASRELSDQLQHALDSRVVIEQAKGIIAARREVDLAEAFGLLRARARSSRAPIHEIAAAVVEGRGEP
jgi:AmiR/NasT family two-component response regulator